MRLLQSTTCYLYVPDFLSSIPNAQLCSEIYSPVSSIDVKIFTCFFFGLKTMNRSGIDRLQTDKIKL